MSYTYITSKDSPNYTPAAETSRAYGMPRVIEGITIHWWGDPATNPTFDGVVNYLCRNDGNSSAHFVATGTGRKVACIVSPGDTAWHSGNAWGNARTIGIECDPRARDEDYDVVAELVADIRSAFGDVLIYAHNDFSSTRCPGVYDLNRIDQLSYTKFSSNEWGKGGNKSAPAPAPTPTPVPPTPVPTPTLYKLVIDNKQVAAYSTDTNAWKGYLEYGSKGSIMYNGKAVTQDLKAKFQAPSPTAPSDPDTGVPTTDRSDYDKAQDDRISKLESVVNWIQEFLSGLFKNFTKK